MAQKLATGDEFDDMYRKINAIVDELPVGFTFTNGVLTQKLANGTGYQVKINIPASTGSATVTASNGLNATNGDVKLGGNITRPTKLVVDTGNTYDILGGTNGSTFTQHFTDGGGQPVVSTEVTGGDGFYAETRVDYVNRSLPAAHLHAYNPDRGYDAEVKAYSDNNGSYVNISATQSVDIVAPAVTVNGQLIGGKPFTEITASGIINPVRDTTYWTRGSYAITLLIPSQAGSDFRFKCLGPNSQLRISFDGTSPAADIDGTAISKNEYVTLQPFQAKTLTYLNTSVGWLDMSRS